MKHKYWVHFRMGFVEDPSKTIEGGMGIYREQPITDPIDIEEVKRAVANQMGMELKLPPNTQVTVIIFTWKKFESLIQMPS